MGQWPSHLPGWIMRPEVVARKLESLREILSVRRPFSGARLNEVIGARCRVERIFELLVTVAADLVQHLWLEQGVFADSYARAFSCASELPASNE